MHQSHSAWMSGRLRQGLHLVEEAIRKAAVDSSCVCSDSFRIWLAIGLTDLREFDQARELLYPDDPHAEPDELVEVTAGPALSRAYLAVTATDRRGRPAGPFHEILRAGRLGGRAVARGV
jgi:hypothetical protein